MTREDLFALTCTVSQTLQTTQQMLHSIAQHVPVPNPAWDACMLTETRLTERSYAVTHHTAAPPVHRARWMANELSRAIKWIDQESARPMPQNMDATLASVRNKLTSCLCTIEREIARSAEKETTPVYELREPINTVRSEIHFLLAINRNGHTRAELYERSQLADTIGDIEDALKQMLGSNEIQNERNNRFVLTQALAA